MRNEYTGLRKWDNWGAMFLVLCVFAIDTGLGNVYKVVGSEDYVTQVYQYVSFKEIFGLMPYCLLMIIALGLDVKFDKFDVAVYAILAWDKMSSNCSSC